MTTTQLASKKLIRNKKFENLKTVFSNNDKNIQIRKRVNGTKNNTFHTIKHKEANTQTGMMIIQKKKFFN